MKRRGFLGLLAGLVALPGAALAAIKPKPFDPTKYTIVEEVVEDHTDYEALGRHIHEQTIKSMAQTMEGNFDVDHLRYDRQLPPKPHHLQGGSNQLAVRPSDLTAEQILRELEAMREPLFGTDDFRFPPRRCGPLKTARFT